MPVLVVALNSFLTEPTEMLPDTRNTKFSWRGWWKKQRIASSFSASWNLVILPPTLPGQSSSRLPGPSLYVAGLSWAGRGVCKESHRLAFPRGGVLSVCENARSKGWRKNKIGDLRGWLIKSTVAHRPNLESGDRDK